MLCALKAAQVTVVQRTAEICTSEEVQGLATLGGPPAPHLLRAVLPVGKKPLTVSANLVPANFEASVKL